jgi:hypothetical protein
MNNEALVVGVSSFLGVAVYLYIGSRLARRTVTPATRLPAMQFALFWIGIAASTALSGIQSLIATFQTPPLALSVSFEYYDVVIIAAALWGLISYLYFLYTGRNGVVGITLLYVLEFGLLVYYFSAGSPNGVSVHYGVASLTYATPLSGPITDLAVLILVIPEFVAGFAYLRLYFRTQDRTVKYRIALVSASILGWFFLDFVNFGSLSQGNLIGLFVGQLLLFSVALLVILAYYPPRWVRARLGVATITEERPAPQS